MLSTISGSNSIIRTEVGTESPAHALKPLAFLVFLAMSKTSLVLYIVAILILYIRSTVAISMLYIRSAYIGGVYVGNCCSTSVVAMTHSLGTWYM